MTNVAIPSPGQLPHGVRRLPRPLALTLTALVVLALMALSFAVGTATMSRHATAKPQAPQVTVQPAGTAHPATRGGLDCREHKQC